MINQQITAIFEEIADIMEIFGEDHFRVNTYRKVARVAKDTGDDLKRLANEDKLEGLAGVGKTSAEKIRQYIETGKIKAHKDLLERIPHGLLDMLAIPGMGPKGVRSVWKGLGVESIDDLKNAIEDKRFESLPGFGTKKAQSILKGIDFLDSTQGRIRLDQALMVAERITGTLRKLKSVKNIELAGSLRRCCETIGDIDVLVQADNSDEIVTFFTEMADVQEVLAAGQTKASVRFYRDDLCPDPVQVDLRIVPAESMGAAWQYFTGSQAHNVRLREIAVKKKLKLNEYGLFKEDKLVAGKTEQEIYKKLGLAYVPPTMREDRGEVELAQENKLPKVVQQSDIRGDMHMHTTASDGRAEIDDQISMARQLGYKYIAITDHSRSSAIAHGLDTERLLAHAERVRKIDKQTEGLTIFAGSEVDILTDGSLDYPDDVLAQLDYVIASIHAGQKSDGDRNTRRLLSAMDNPYVNCLAHPTARLVNMREPMELDLERIFEKAAKTKTAMEISAAPKRLDLKDIHCRQAAKAGVKFLINTDAHDALAQTFIHYGVATAQRGWITKADVINAKPLKSLRSWLTIKRK